MDHILITTDFSKNAFNATAYALRFFKGQKTVFHFLHIDITLQASSVEDVHSAGVARKHKVSNKTKAEMESWMEKVNSYDPNPNHRLTDVILQGRFVESIRTYIKRHKIEFLVMGTKGASGLKERTIGSKTGAVITRVKCPMLVIPEDATYKKPIHIGLPTDFNLLYENRVIKTLLATANMHQSSVKVLRVAQTEKPLDIFQNTNRKLLKRKLCGIPHSFHVIEDPNLENALQSFVNTMQIDMVAMIAKNLNFFQRLLFKPRVAKISYHIQIPFLILHE